MVMPFLLVLMFGSLEFGKYFLDEHVVVKAVRDGARYASRQSFAGMACGATATNETQIRNLVRYGKVTVGVGDKPRLFYWTDPTSITVTTTCYDNSGAGGTRVYSGVYTGRATVPRVTVRARVPYQPIAASFGFRNIGLFLDARSQSPVLGL